MSLKDDVYATSEQRDLIRRAQCGGQEACDNLRRQYAPLVASMVKQFCASCRTEQEKADMAEEADAVFLNAVSSYDTEQDEVSFGLYAQICLRNGLVSALRHIEVLRRLSIVSLSEEQLSEWEDVAAGVASDDRFLWLSRLIQDSLSGYEQKVWWAYVAGTPVARIAARMGKDEKSVYNAIYRIRRKLRDRLGNEQG